MQAGSGQTLAYDYGYCAARKTRYFGYRLHATCTTEGILKTFDISKASCHDIRYLNDVQEQLANCVPVGDKGCLSQHWQQDMFEQAAIRLTTPVRQNRHDYKPFGPILRRARKRIETLFSQLCDQFMIRRNHASLLAGLPPVSGRASRRQRLFSG